MSTANVTGVLIATDLSASLLTRLFVVVVAAAALQAVSLLVDLAISLELATLLDSLLEATGTL